MKVTRMEEKTPKEKVKNRTKKNPVWFLSHPFIYKKEADCFPVSKGTENKPDLP